MNVRVRLLAMLAAAMLLVGLASRAGATFHCTASCSEPNCPCVRSVTCSIYEVCVKIEWCSTETASVCDAWCEDDPETPRDPFNPTPRLGRYDTGARFTAAADWTLGSLGHALQLGCGWGVSMSSSVMALEYPAGTYGSSTMTFEQMVEAVANAADATTSWNDTTKVITFTAQ